MVSTLEFRGLISKRLLWIVDAFAMGELYGLGFLLGWGCSGLGL